jgi:endonuclease/exonuclease/phosphatase (EEP) superfamily protein YafD
MSVELGSRPPRPWECCVLLVLAALALADRSGMAAVDGLRGTSQLPQLLGRSGMIRHGLQPAPKPNADEGSLSLLTYNVAGLPAGISRSRPATNIPLISPLLNRYDLVLVQEDFAYQLDLRRDVEHPYRSPLQLSSIFDTGDGLSRFSRHPFSGFGREAWRACHGVLAFGSDCLARKGFSVATHELSPGILVDVYDLHMDAGGGFADRDARQAQIDQLIEAIARRSRGRAVIVAGDTNLRRLRDRRLLTRLLDRAGLEDSCQELRCGEPGRVDRVLYRSSASLELSARSWRTDPAFRDADGRALSDHRAVAVVFDWRRRKAGSTAGAAHDTASERLNAIR